MVKLAFPFLFLACLMPLVSQASPGLKPDQAAALAREAMAQAGISGADPVAPSRALPECDGTVTAAPHAGDWSTVALTCASPRWTRALRTRAKTDNAAPAREGMDSQITGTVLGLTRSLGKGATITIDDLGPVPQVTAAPAEVFIVPDDLVGRRLRQSLAPGKPILARHLEPDYLVQEGGPVVIVTRTGPVTVSSLGRAKGSATLGELVTVMNLASGRSIMARVTGKDIVSVMLKPSETRP